LTLQAAAVLLLAALVALFARGLLQNTTTVYALVKDGDTPSAPNFTLPLLDGRGQASLTQYRGRVVLLNFWASWCDACKLEAPVLNQAVHAYGNRGVVVVGVDTNDFSGDGRGFARQYDQRYTLVHDSGDDVSSRWGIGTGLPVTYVIDRRGRVVHLFDGTVSGEDLAHVLAPLLRVRST
jgi:cytochrome c biogenesis protein CcmG/thiol:disulfide interchange protein DsbE